MKLKTYRQRTVIKYAAYILLLTVLFLFQTSPFRTIRLLNVTPELILPTVLLVAMYDGERVGAICAIFAGLIYDANSAIVGFNTVFFIIAAYMTGILISTQIKRNVISAIIICSISVFLLNLITYIAFVGLRGEWHLLYVLKSIILPKTIYTFFISAALYFVFYFIKMYLFAEETEVL